MYYIIKTCKIAGFFRRLSLVTHFLSGDCPFEGMCHRNCKRLNSAYYDDRYCGYRELLEYAGERMQQIARTLR